MNTRTILELSKKTIEIEVELCWSGGNKYHYRLIGPDGWRFKVRVEEGADFSSVKQEAERILSLEYGNVDEFVFNER